MQDNQNSKKRGGYGVDKSQRKPYRKDTYTAGGEKPFRKDGDKPFRKDGDRPFRKDGDKPFRKDGDRPFRKDGDRPFRKDGDKPFRKDGDRPFRKDGDRPFRKDGDKPFRKFDRSEDKRFERKKKEYEAEESATEASLLGAADETDGDTVESGAVIGRNAVRELLKSGRDIDKVFVQKGERTGSIVMLVAEAIERGIPLVEVEKSKLDGMAGFAPHQGIIAMAAEKQYCSVEDILKIATDRGEAPIIVIADGITDPYNLGALIRCAEGVGAHGLIIPKRHAAGLTPLVTKASAGAIEHLAVCKVPNIVSAVRTLKEAGVWVYAAEAGGDAYYDCNFKGACALVVGSEGDGVSRLVKETCDGVVSIPMFGHVNSFNVSTAGAVILAEISKQHRA